MSGIEKIASWLKKTEGRDKLCKVLQYVCRLLAEHFRTRDEYDHLMFESLFESARQARKLFRIFKSIDEYQAILHLAFYGEEELATLLHIISKFLYFIYWAIDNMSVAAKIKLFQLDWKAWHRVGLKVRFIALLLSIVTFAYELKVKKFNDKDRDNNVLKVAKNVFDLLPAGKDSGIFTSLNEYVTSLGGLTSALISTYQIYQQA